MEFGGSVRQYVGQRLLLWRDGDEFDLRFEDDVVGRLTRPGEAYLAETRDGSWELWHKRRTAPKIRVTDAASGAEVANYKRRAFRNGGRIVAGQNTYQLRPRHLLDSSGQEVFTMAYDIEENGLLSLTPVSVDSDDVSMLAMLCSYISLLENVPVPDSTPASGPMT